MMRCEIARAVKSLKIFQTGPCKSRSQSQAYRNPLETKDPCQESSTPMNCVLNLTLGSGFLACKCFRFIKGTIDFMSKGSISSRVHGHWINKSRQRQSGPEKLPQNEATASPKASNAEKGKRNFRNHLQDFLKDLGSCCPLKGTGVTFTPTPTWVTFDPTSITCLPKV